MLTASPHSSRGRFFSFNILHTKPIMVPFFPSTTPFCYGVYGAVSCFLIPLLSQKLLNALEVNSPPQSLLTLLIFTSFSALGMDLNFLNCFRAFDFSLSRATHIHLKKSSTIKKKYLFPPKVCGFTGPHMDICINSRTFEAL